MSGEGHGEAASLPDYAEYLYLDMLLQDSDSQVCRLPLPVDSPCEGKAPLIIAIYSE